MGDSHNERTFVMSTSAYHNEQATVNLEWPEAITTPDVDFLVRNLATLGAWVEVGPTTHARNWNTLHLPDGTNYTTYGASNWWTLEDECSCNGANRDGCPACRATARRVYGRAS